MSDMNAQKMNGDYNTESFNRAYRTLRMRYSGRINNGLTNAAVKEQHRNELSSMNEHPAAYRYCEIMEHDRVNLYRTAIYNGKNVMTVEDMKRIYYDETGRRCDHIARGAATGALNSAGQNRTVVPSRPAAPYRVLETGDANAESFGGERSVVFSADGKLPANVEKPGHDEKSKLEVIMEKIFPGEKIANVRKRRINSFPAAALALILIFTLVLLIPVTMTVLIHQASVDVNDLNSELRDLQAEADELRVELDTKNDLRLIEDIAVNQYGMIRLERSTSRFLQLNRSDVIESYAESTQNPGVVPALLSALGIRVNSD